jgi:AhpD family alkylhydroperoxidase
MQARMGNPAMVVPGAMKALLALSGSAEQAGLPKELLELVHLRVSQINGCSVCVDMHGRALQQSGEPVERFLGVTAWREMPYFTEAERAALELAECVTRVADKPDPVPDDVWQAAAKHYTEEELGALLVAIGSINVWNRLNAATRQVAGTAWN